jgi:hypothetical protein
MPIQRITADPYMIPNPDSTRHYRWLSDDPKRLALWLRSLGDSPGYRVERGDTVDATGELAEKLGFAIDYVDKSRNCIRFGFNILASIPVEEHEARMEYMAQQQYDAISSAEDSFMAEADRVPGVRGIKRDPEEHKDRKSHAAREGRPFAGQVSGRRSSR